MNHLTDSLRYAFASYWGPRSGKSYWASRAFAQHMSQALQLQPQPSPKILQAAAGYCEWCNYYDEGFGTQLLHTALQQCPKCAGTVRAVPLKPALPASSTPMGITRFDDPLAANNGHHYWFWTGAEWLRGAHWEAHGKQLSQSLQNMGSSGASAAPVWPAMSGTTFVDQVLAKDPAFAVDPTGPVEEPAKCAACGGPDDHCPYGIHCAC